MVCYATMDNEYILKIKKYCYNNYNRGTDLMYREINRIEAHKQTKVHKDFSTMIKTCIKVE